MIKFVSKSSLLCLLTLVSKQDFITLVQLCPQVLNLSEKLCKKNGGSLCQKSNNGCAKMVTLLPHVWLTTQHLIIKTNTTHGLLLTSIILVEELYWPNGTSIMAPFQIQFLEIQAFYLQILKDSRAKDGLHSRQLFGHIWLLSLLSRVCTILLLASGNQTLWK